MILQHIPNLSTDKVSVGDIDGIPQEIDKGDLDTNIGNTNLDLTGDRTLDLLTHTLTLDGTGNNGTPFQVNCVPTYTDAVYARVNLNGGMTLRGSKGGDGGLKVISGYPNSTDQIFKVERFGGGSWTGGTTTIGTSTTSTRLVQSNDNLRLYDINNNLRHDIGLNSGSLNQYCKFFVNGYLYNGKFIVGSSGGISTEKIAFHGQTSIKGDGITTGTTLGLYNNDTTPQLNWSFLDDGALFTNENTSLIKVNKGFRAIHQGFATGTNPTTDDRWNNFWFEGNGSFNQTRFYIRSGNGTDINSGISTIFLQGGSISQSSITGDMTITTPDTLNLGTTKIIKLGVGIDPRTSFDSTYSTSGAITVFDSRFDPWVFQSNYSSTVALNLIGNDLHGVKIDFKNNSGAVKGYILNNNVTGDLTIQASGNLNLTQGGELSIAVPTNNTGLLSNEVWQDDGILRIGTSTSPVRATLTKNLTLEEPVATDDISIFRTDVAITVQEVISISTGTSPNTTYQLKHSTDRNAAGNDLTTSGTTTSTTTGDTATLSDDTIPANSFIWFECSASSGTDVYLGIEIRYTED